MSEGDIFFILNFFIETYFEAVDTYVFRATTQGLTKLKDPTNLLSNKINYEK
jgi:hypothetical protein